MNVLRHRPADREVPSVKRAPWHSTSPGDTVYHDNDKCIAGSRIDPTDRKEGTGGRPLCNHCAVLDAQRK
jgi:hypothetical protein